MQPEVLGKILQRNSTKSFLNILFSIADALHLQSYQIRK